MTTHFDPLHLRDAQERREDAYDSPQQRARDIERFSASELEVFSVFDGYQCELRAMRHRHAEEAASLLAEWKPALDKVIKRTYRG